jgi:serine-type D-Ala-D-Ala carboxypeptidase/endopeptidase
LKRNQALAKILIVLFVASIILSVSSFSQSLNIDVLAQNPKEHKWFSPSNQSGGNDLSKMILDKYKPRVLEHLFSNKTIANTISNSSIPVSIVVWGYLSKRYSGIWIW